MRINSNVTFLSSTSIKLVRSSSTREGEVGFGAIIESQTDRTTLHFHLANLRSSRS